MAKLKKKTENRGRKPTGRMKISSMWIRPERWFEILQSQARLRLKLKRQVGYGEVIERSNAGKE